MKTCIRCGATKGNAEFYAHPSMSDGVDSKCKECAKAATRTNYERTNGRSGYEQRRFKDPARKAKILVYQRASRARDPVKYAARTAVGNAVRDGKLVRQPCRLCGSTTKVQAHHHDYSKPLDVEWLCFRCHREHEHGQKIRTETI